MKRVILSLLLALTASAAMAGDSDYVELLTALTQLYHLPVDLAVLLAELPQQRCELLVAALGLGVVEVDVVDRLDDVARDERRGYEREKRHCGEYREQRLETFQKLRRERPLRI